MLNGPFSPWPSFTDEEANAARDVLLSNRVNYWTGDEVKKFEDEFSQFSETEFAIALANGSVAIDCALHALEIGCGDEVIVTSRTFIASASSIVLAGATPVFVDVELNSQNISPLEIEKSITNKTKAILCVHLAGWPCEMDDILDIAKLHGLYVIEDCAQAHGASYKGRKVGSIGDVGCWSFCQDKIMSTGGEGGMVTTRSRKLWDRMWSYKDHGKSWDAVFNRAHPPGFRWLHESFGTNLRMTEMQAAIGRIQIRKMPEWHSSRIKNARTIWNCAQRLSGFRVPNIPESIKHAAYKCYIFVEKEKLAPEWSRDKVLSEISRQGVPCFSGSCSEVYNEKAFTNRCIEPSRPLHNAHSLGESSLMFLVHPTLTQNEIMKTCNVIEKVAKLAFK